MYTLIPKNLHFVWLTPMSSPEGLINFNDVDYTHTMNQIYNKDKELSLKYLYNLRESHINRASFQKYLNLIHKKKDIHIMNTLNSNKNKQPKEHPDKGIDYTDLRNDFKSLRIDVTKILNITNEDTPHFNYIHSLKISEQIYDDWDIYLWTFKDLIPQTVKALENTTIHIKDVSEIGISPESPYEDTSRETSLLPLKNFDIRHPYFGTLIDYTRYLIIYYHGGLSHDINFIPFNKIDDRVLEYSAITTSENYYFACAKYHPLMASMIAIFTPTKNNIMLDTDNQIINKYFAEYLRHNRCKVYSDTPYCTSLMLNKDDWLQLVTVKRSLSYHEKDTLTVLGTDIHTHGWIYNKNSQNTNDIFNQLKSHKISNIAHIMINNTKFAIKYDNCLFRVFQSYEDYDKNNEPIPQNTVNQDKIELFCSNINPKFVRTDIILCGKGLPLSPKHLASYISQYCIKNTQTGLTILHHTDDNNDCIPLRCNREIFIKQDTGYCTPIISENSEVQQATGEVYVDKIEL